MNKDLPEIVATCPKAAGRPRASELEARNHNLIHTVSQLFLQHGYSKVSLEMIAREAHVAVRTIYVKFGGKTGLLRAVLVANRERFFDVHEMDSDARPFRVVVRAFAEHFLDLIEAPEAINMKRIVVAEASASPELAETFFEAGPNQTRMMLLRFFQRPEIGAQLRADLDVEILPVHLLNCISGDYYSRLVFAADPQPKPRAEKLRALDARLDLFFHAVLHRP